ncbi:hypothetical protein J6590_022489 [Homalodisca vitripennis]|nr:hypothetical protein J6590_022489 [Homalodisca vitripennis]
MPVEGQPLLASPPLPVLTTKERTNVDDEEGPRRPTVMNEDLTKEVDEEICQNKRFTIDFQLNPHWTAKNHCVTQIWPNRSSTSLTANVEILGCKGSLIGIDNCER